MLCCWRDGCCKWLEGGRVQTRGLRGGLSGLHGLARPYDDPFPPARRRGPKKKWLMSPRARGARAGWVGSPGARARGVGQARSPEQRSEPGQNTRLGSLQTCCRSAAGSFEFGCWCVPEISVERPRPSIINCSRLDASVSFRAALRHDERPRQRANGSAPAPLAPRTPPARPRLLRPPNPDCGRARAPASHKLGPGCPIAPAGICSGSLLDVHGKGPALATMPASLTVGPS